MIQVSDLNSAPQEDIFDLSEDDVVLTAIEVSDDEDVSDDDVIEIVDVIDDEDVSESRIDSGTPASPIEKKPIRLDLASSMAGDSEFHPAPTNLRSSRSNSGLLVGSLEQAAIELEELEKNRADDEDGEDEEIKFPVKQLPKDDMDMTPMVDVTFLLLIFFMVTASFSKEKVFNEPPPLSDKSNMNTEPPPVVDLVRVQIDEFNGYTIILPGGDEREASSKQDLLLALSDAKAEVETGSNADNLKLMIEAHVESIHAAIVAAVDAGRDKGFANFQVQVVEEFQ